LHIYSKNAFIYKLEIKFDEKTFFFLLTCKNLIEYFICKIRILIYLIAKKKNMKRDTPRKSKTTIKASGFILVKKDYTHRLLSKKQNVQLIPSIFPTASFVVIVERAAAIVLELRSTAATAKSVHHLCPTATDMLHPNQSPIG
jgi:hypothetical protein